MVKVGHAPCCVAFSANPSVRGGCASYDTPPTLGPLQDSHVLRYCCALSDGFLFQRDAFDLGTIARPLFYASMLPTSNHSSST